jgi:hypothetical protein
LADSLEIALTGRHNVRNALAATAAALALGVPLAAVQAGLLTLTPVPGRLYPRRCDGLRILDDTYNANPDSLAAAIDVLAALPGPRWLVLGDLGELGPASVALHAEVGALARGHDPLDVLGVDAYREVEGLCTAAGAEVAPGSGEWEAAYREATGSALVPAKQNDTHSCGWYAVLAIAHAAGKHADAASVDVFKSRLFEEELARRAEAGGGGDSSDSGSVECVEDRV